MIYVSMTDKFMSDWGPAEGKLNKLVIRCQTMKQAKAVKAAARQREEMTQIRIDNRFPVFDREKVVVSRLNFSDLSGPWRAHYHG